MTEAEWRLTIDSQAMYALMQESTTLMRTRWQGWVPVRRFRFSARREILFRCAVCARLLDIVQAESARRTIDLIRLRQFGQIGRIAPADNPPLAFLADLRLTHPPRQATAWEALRALTYLDGYPPHDWLYLAAQAPADFASPSDDLWQRARLVEAERAAQADLLREFAGNPFATPTLPEGWQSWQDGLILGMARRIDAEEDFAALPVLGDALEDAGCIDADILGHCRQAGPHLRGCWVLELLLERE